MVSDRRRSQQPQHQVFLRLLVVAVLCIFNGSIKIVQAFMPPLPSRTSVMPSSRQYQPYQLKQQQQHQQQPSHTALAALGPQQVYLAADIAKIVSDDVYGPMFFQALFLSVSGFLAAAALAAVIAFRGDALTEQLLNEAYQERDNLKARLGTQEDSDGNIMVGFNKDPNEPAASAAASSPPPSPSSSSSSPPAVDTATAAAAETGRKELVGATAARSSTSGSEVNDFED